MLGQVVVTGREEVVVGDEVQAVILAPMLW